MTNSPKKDDVFITWNRVARADNVAKTFEREGCTVLVVENSSWGNTFAGSNWFHMARTYHNTAGMVDYHGPERWHDLGVVLDDWRTDGETIILPQRGIGSAPVAMPKWFPKRSKRDHGGRIRKHPGIRVRVPLEDDLQQCRKVVTWGSGAAIKALMMGIQVTSYMPNWIGEQDNTEHGRMDMFRRLAWAQWTHQEIESGFAFETLIHR